MKGRKPIPSNIHLLQGGTNKTHRSKKHRAGEPKLEAKIPPCPKHLDKESRAEWRRMAKEFRALGVLAMLDKAVFAVYCKNFAEWAKATRMIQEQGMIMKEAEARMMRALVEIGMTPSSRSRVKATPKKEESPEDEFMKGAK